MSPSLIDHVGRIDAETFAGDLRERGFQPLADALDAGADFEAAVRRDAGERLLVEHAALAVGGGAVGGLLGEDRDAEPDQAAIRLAALLPRAHGGKVDRRHGSAQDLRIVAAVEVLVGDVVERHLVGAHQVRKPHLVRLLADLARDRIDHQLHRVADVRARDAAIGKLRALVGHDAGGPAAIDRNIIRAGQDRRDLRGLDGGGEGIGRVGSGIDRGLGLERDELALLVGVGRDRVVMFAAIGVRRELLAPVFEPAHRMAALHRQPAQADLLGGQNRLVAEAAADVGRHHANLNLGNLQNLRKAGADDVRKLGGAVQRQLALSCLPHGNEAAAFDRRHDMARGAELACHLHRRGPGGGLHRTVETDFEKHVSLDGVVDLDAARLLRLEHVHDRRQFLVVDGDLRRDVLRFGAGVGDAHRDQLADMADPVGDQRRLLRRLEAGQGRYRTDIRDAFQVLGDENRIPQMIADADAGELGMRDRAADERDLAHPGKAQVADILPASVEEAFVFPAAQSGPDAGLAQSSGLRNADAPNAPHNVTLAPAVLLKREIRPPVCINHHHVA